MLTLFCYYFKYFTKNNRYNSKLIVTRLRMTGSPLALWVWDSTVKCHCLPVAWPAVFLDQTECTNLALKCYYWTYFSYHCHFCAFLRSNNCPYSSLLLIILIIANSRVGVRALLVLLFIIGNKCYYFFIIFILRGTYYSSIFFSLVLSLFSLVFSLLFLFEKKVRGHINRHYLLIFYIIVFIWKLSGQLLFLQLLGLLLLLLLFMTVFLSQLEPCDKPSGTRIPPTPDVSPSHAPPPPLPSLRQRAMA